ncbi:LSM domain-containing protein [Plasmodiophora brassicae]|uniref:LSM domain-containing protein n=1 Tax=Plasmodiophora brassicae TaxID=37360 RepID=A0A0G4J2P8_PLABS|nr:hypothetical protein PBRA_008861 [Plasmodiophora brassicae]SPQ98694.1 unnamed protein product [Plasmodiophora brassicae]
MATPRDRVAQCLGQRCIVWAIDGRVLRGRFSCLDHLGNMILDHTAELRPPDIDDKHAAWHEEHRVLQMGNVLFPSACMTRIEFEEIL